MSIEYKLYTLVISKELYDKFLTEENPDTSRWIAIPFSVENYCSEQYLVISAIMGVLYPIEDYLWKHGELTQVIEVIDMVVRAYYHAIGYLSYLADIKSFVYYVQDQEHQYDGNSRVYLLQVPSDSNSEEYKLLPDVVDSNNITEQDIITTLFQCIRSKRIEIAELVKSEFVNITNVALDIMK